MKKLFKSTRKLSSFKAKDLKINFKEQSLKPSFVNADLKFGRINTDYMVQIHHSSDKGWAQPMLSPFEPL